MFLMKQHEFQQLSALFFSSSNTNCATLRQGLELCANRKTSAYSPQHWGKDSTVKQQENLSFWSHTFSSTEVLSTSEGQRQNMRYLYWSSFKVTQIWIMKIINVRLFQKLLKQSPSSLLWRESDYITFSQSGDLALHSRFLFVCFIA